MIKNITTETMKNDIPNSVEIIDSHLDEFFTDEDDIVVFDEIESEIIHRDIYFIKAVDDRPYHILLSCGMSALPMNVPGDVESSEFAEVMMLLPTRFYPVSPAPYLNGGPKNFLSWIIENTDREFTPDNMKEWLEGRLH